MKSGGGREFRVLIIILLSTYLSPLMTEPNEFIPAAAAQNLQETTDVFFNPDDHGIPPEDESKLKENVTLLKSDPGLIVNIEGYSDITGEEQYNLNLSRLRAEAVRKFYISQGIGPGRVKARGNGKTDKFDSGIDEESLKRNRRVHIVLESSRAKSPPSILPPPTHVPEVSPVPTSEPEGQVPRGVAAENTAQDEPAQEPLSPAVVELSAPPPDLEKAIERSMRKLAPGRIVFNAPREMSIGESYDVEVDLSYSFLKGLSDALNSMSAQGFDKVRLGKNIGLSLKGRGFDIRPVTETEGVEEVFPVEDTGTTKEVTENSTSTWKWKVAPSKSGFQSLLLSIEIMAEDADYNEMSKEYPLFQKVIEVKSNFLFTVTRSYLIMAAFIVIVVAAVGWILIKRLRVS